MGKANEEFVQEWKTIRISFKNYERLQLKGRTGESFNDVLDRVLNNAQSERVTERRISVMNGSKTMPVSSAVVTPSVPQAGGDDDGVLTDEESQVFLKKIAKIEAERQVVLSDESEESLEIRKEIINARQK